VKFLLLLFLALPAVAEEKVLQIPGLQCTEGGICVIPIDVINAMIDVHNKNVQTIRDLKAQGPKCAEVEITEPSKNAPKKLPPIPKESES
jgi:hypothetical protein